MNPTTNRSDLQDRSGFRKIWIRVPGGVTPKRDLRWLLQRLIKMVLWAYLRIFHDFEMRYHPDLPRDRPFIAVINHTSMLDVPALMVIDCNDPPTAMVVKSEGMRWPLIGRLLRAWGAIPVDRHGRDMSAIRRIKQTLSEGRSICIAPSGTRSDDGRLGPISPVLARLIAQSEVDVVPTAIVGGFECLPRGRKLPRPGKMYCDAGAPIDLRRFRGHRLSDDELVEAANEIQSALAALLPDHMKPVPGAAVMGTYREAGVDPR